MNGNRLYARNTEMASRHHALVNDCQWAPIAARSFHLIATCSKDRTVILWRAVLYDVMKESILNEPQFSPI